MSQRVVEDRLLLQDIYRVQARAHGSYGYRRVFAALLTLKQRKMKGKFGCGRVVRLMRENGIASNRKRRRKSTTRVTRILPDVVNLLKRQFTTNRPDAAWVSDISYIRTGEGWLYLAVVIDLYARRVVGWAVSSRQTQELASRALQMAITHRRPPVGLIHHSDRGSQYTSHAYRSILNRYQIRMSMSKTGSCMRTGSPTIAVAESFFSTIKSEWLHGQRFAMRQAAQNAIFCFIEVFYNRQRLHSTLGYVSPLAFENAYYQSKGICLN